MVSISHNYDELSKGITDSNCFMAMYAILTSDIISHSTLTYETNAIPTPCRFVSVQVDFVSDDARQSHRYCSLPVYFDRFSIILPPHPF